MAAQAGKNMLINIGNGDGPPETFTLVGGLRSPSISMSRGEVDVTCQGSTDLARELLAEAGVTTVSVSGSGVFKDSAGEVALHTANAAGALHTFQLVVPDLGTFEGEFLITSLEYSGSYDADMQFSFSLASSGVIGFTAA